MTKTKVFNENIDYLVNKNMNLVWAIVNRFKNSSKLKDDMFQSGCIGLIDAARRFDKTKGVQFSTFAFPYILGEVRAFLRTQSPVKYSKNFFSVIKLVNKTIESFYKQHQREPSSKEIQEILNIDHENVLLALGFNKGYVSLNEYTDTQKNKELIDNLCYKKKFDNIEKINLELALNTLPKDEKKIIMLRYYYGYSQVEVGKMMGITQSKVSRLEKVIFQALKEKISA